MGQRSAEVEIDKYVHISHLKKEFIMHLLKISIKMKPLVTSILQRNLSIR